MYIKRSSSPQIIEHSRYPEDAWLSSISHGYAKEESKGRVFVVSRVGYWKRKARSRKDAKAKYMSDGGGRRLGDDWEI